MIGDFERHLATSRPAAGPRIVAFLGGTIGNFPPGSRRRFLREIARLLGAGDHLLMGTDLVKDPRRAARPPTTTPQGVTAEFNRNVLHVLNRELQADFDPDDFDHVALFDREHEWIEMRLRARRELTARVGALNMTVHFDAGEELRTEISAKFTPERLEGDLAAAGLELASWLTDPDELFALTLSRPRGRDAARAAGPPAGPPAQPAVVAPTLGRQRGPRAGERVRVAAALLDGHVGVEVDGLIARAPSSARTYSALQSCTSQQQHRAGARRAVRAHPLDRPRARRPRRRS